MRMDQGVDTGAIINQRAMKIEDDDTAGSLFEKLSRLGADLLIETLPRYLSGEFKPQSQNEGKATNASILKKEDGSWILHSRLKNLLDACELSIHGPVRILNGMAES